jgi:hypothetical protein
MFMHQLLSRIVLTESCRTPPMQKSSSMTQERQQGMAQAKEFIRTGLAGVTPREKRPSLIRYFAFDAHKPWPSHATDVS